MFLDKVKCRFENVEVDDEGIDTYQFLESAKGVVLMFDELHSTAFAPVKSDINGNITKVYNKFNQDPVKFRTLQSIIINEAGSKDRTATQGLLWLKRGLEFCAVALINNIETPSEQLSDSFYRAYEVTLKQFHSFFVRPIFSLAMKACPKSEDFYAKIGTDVAQVKEGLLVWAKALKALVDMLSQFYTKGNFDKGL